MKENIHEYKCPNCGGSLSFDSGTQKMKCPYCDSEIDVEALKYVDEELNNFTDKDSADWERSGKVWQEGESEGMRIYVCQSCGGEIIADENMAAGQCPYCSNPVVMMGQLAGDLKPDYIIPFKLDKEAAKEAYKKHLKHRPLLVSLFKEQNHIDEIKGLYVPFWLYDADSDGSAAFKATKVRSWSDSRNRYTDTSYYSVIRKGKMAFAHIPADGSSKMPDDLMESIEPFDFSQAVDFKTAYLSGYMADRYDVSSEDEMDRASQRVKNSTMDCLKETVKGYSTVTLEKGNVSISNAKAKYAMYPVWILNTTYAGKQYVFAMNGQTGKMVGDLPIAKGKLWLFRLFFTLGFAFIVYFIITFFLNV